MPSDQDEIRAIALENLDHENAFTRSDLRLLIPRQFDERRARRASFDETQRLSKDRGATPSSPYINSVQEGLARKLDFQIVDLIGEKVRNFQCGYRQRWVCTILRQYIATYYVDRSEWRLQSPAQDPA
jgi:hypothetical protein